MATFSIPNESKTGKLAAAALAYAQRLGWAVLPLHSIKGGLCTCGKADCAAAGKHPLTATGVKSASKDPAVIAGWWQQWPWANPGIATGAASGFWALDVDGQVGRDSLADLEAAHGKLPDTVEQLTGGGGRHVLFRHPGGTVKNAVAIAPGLDGRADAGYIVAPPSLHKSGRTYVWEASSRPGEVPLADAPAWLLDKLRPAASAGGLSAAGWTVDVPEGRRNAELTRRAGFLLRAMPEAEALPMLETWNAKHCKPPLPAEEVRAVVASIGRREAEKPPQEFDTEAAAWPDPLAAEAFHGLAGDIVRTIEPHTEADPAALLITFLLTFGNVLGRTAHARAEGDYHYTNLFACLVGSTSKGRKGVSLGQIKALFAGIDPAWASGCTAQGLSSGEGLIWAVRDDVWKTTHDKKTKAKTQILEHEGAADKRLFVIEPEFARVLRVLEREGNSLSAVLRQGWDSGDLAILTKQATAKASGAHISLLAHITKAELLRYLQDTETANGFGNRFLWLCVRRSKCLPEGGQLHTVNLEPLRARLNAAVAAARSVGVVSRDPAARALWAAIYPELSEGKPGLLGAMTARAEAQVLRLSVLYALLDCAAVVRAEHVRASLAVWDYCEASARFIFGASLGDPVANEILRALKAAPAGLSRTDLRDLFQRNQSAARIGHALGALAETGKLRIVKEGAAGERGRQTERFFLH